MTLNAGCGARGLDIAEALEASGALEEGSEEGGARKGSGTLVCGLVAVNVLFTGEGALSWSRNEFREMVFRCTNVQQNMNTNIGSTHLGE